MRKLCQFVSAMTTAALLVCLLLPTGVFAEDREMSSYFTVALRDAKIGGTPITDEALQDGSIHISSGTAFQYQLDMAPIDGKTSEFKEGDVLNYHIGSVTGLTFPAESTAETLKIEGTPVGSAVFLYDATSGDMDLRVTFNKAVETYTVGEMTFGQSAQFDLRNAQTPSVTVNLVSVTGGAHSVAVDTGSSQEDTGAYVPEYVSGTVTAADKWAPWNVLPKNSYAYEENGTTYPYVIWNIWFGDAINHYEEAKTAGNSYEMSENLILTESLDENQKFCMGNTDNIAPMLAKDGEAPFEIQLPVHYVGTSFDGQSQSPNSFVWFPKGEETTYGNGQYGYGANKSYYNNSMLQNVKIPFENVNPQAALTPDQVKTAVAEKALSYGVYTENGKETLLVNFGKLGTGSDTLVYENEFLTAVKQRLNAQIAANDADSEMYQKTLEYYTENPGAVYGFFFKIAAYVTTDVTATIKNSAQFSYGSASTIPSASAEVEYTQSASITGTVKNGDFVLKKVDAAATKATSGPLEQANYAGLTGIQGAKAEIYAENETAPLHFTKGSDGVYSYAAEGTDSSINIGAAGVTVRGLTAGKAYLLKETAAPTGYDMAAEQQFTVNNGKVTYFALADEPQTVNPQATKIWDDRSDAGKTRSASVVLQLRKTVDGKTADVQGKTLTLTAANALKESADQWKASFGELPAYENGKAITYSVKETTTAKDYAVTENGMTVTNTYNGKITPPATPEEPDEPATPEKPTEPTTPEKPTTPAKPTTPEKPTEPTAPTVPVKPVTPAAPTIPTVSELPDPNDSESPDEIILITDNRVPTTYIKIHKLDGGYEYVPENQIPEEKLPKTGGAALPWIVFAGISALGMGTAVRIKKNDEE